MLLNSQIEEVDVRTILLAPVSVNFPCIVFRYIQEVANDWPFSRSGR